MATYYTQNLSTEGLTVEQAVVFSVEAAKKNGIESKLNESL